jgi:hypothetical protein
MPRKGLRRAEEFAESDMKNLLLNCDQVFEVLTRGPFPSGAPSDEGVEHHLRACHDCRQLAEALRPAVAMLHESIGRDRAGDLPEYQGSLPQRERRGLRPAVRATSTARAPRSGRAFDQAVGAVRLVAASLLAVALAFLVYGFALAPERPRLGGPFDGMLAHGETTVLPDGPGLLTLTSLKLPSRCVPSSYQALSQEQAEALAQAMSQGAKDALRCCTECHNPTKPLMNRANLVAVTAQSCSACHRG